MNGRAPTLCRLSPSQKLSTKPRLLQTDPDRLGQIAERAGELLHEADDAVARVTGDPAKGGCERACYDCLCTFSN